MLALTGRILRGRSFRAAAWSLGAQVISKLAMLALLSSFARATDVRATGRLLVVLGYALIAFVLLDAGLSTWLQRQAALGEDVRDRSLLLSRIPLMPVWFIACLTPAAFGLYPFEHAPLVVALSGSLTLSAAALGRLQGALRIAESSGAQAVGRLAQTALAAIYLARPSLASVPLTIAGLALCELVVALIASTRMDKLLRAPMAARAILRQGAPHAANSVLNVLYNRADVVIVAAVAGSVVAGSYGPASQIQNALSAVPVALSVTVLSVAAQSTGAVGRAFFRRTLLISCSVSALLGTACATTAHLWVPLVLGQGFQATVPALRVLALALPLSAAAFILSQFSLGIGRAPRVTASIALAFSTTLALHIVLTPRFGAVGAAFAAASREVVIVSVLALYLFIDRRRVAADAL